MACFSPIIFHRRHRAFTLLELLIAVALLSLILLVIFSITQQAGSAWKSARSKVETFQGARLAFDNLTRNLGQATLNTYYDYFDSAGRSSQDPNFGGVDHYGRQSELHFISGKSLIPNQITQSVFFQTPAGYAGDAKFQNMDTLLNSCGYYIVHDKDNLRPGFLISVPNAPVNSVRYRLMQFLQPSEQLAVYASATGSAWYLTPLAGASPPVQQLAENVLALIVLPRMSGADARISGSSLTTGYEYDSRTRSSTTTQLPSENQLPPEVEVVLVAIDEASAIRLSDRKLPGLESLFQSADKLDGDITSLEAELVSEKLTYRIFRTTVALRNSKWSS